MTMTQDTTNNPVTIMTAALLPPPGVESTDPKGWSETINDQTVIDAVLEAECGTLIQEGASIEHIGASALAYAQKIEVITAADQRSIDEYQRRIEYIKRKSAQRIGWLQRRLGYLHTLAMDWMNNFGLKSYKMPGIGTYRWHTQPEFLDDSGWETFTDEIKSELARELPELFTVKTVVVPKKMEIKKSLKNGDVYAIAGFSLSRNPDKFKFVADEEQG